MVYFCLFCYCGNSKETYQLEILPFFCQHKYLRFLNFEITGFSCVCACERVLVKQAVRSCRIYLVFKYNAQRFNKQQDHILKHNLQQISQHIPPIFYRRARAHLLTKPVPTHNIHHKIVVLIVMCPNTDTHKITRIQEQT